MSWKKLIPFLAMDHPAKALIMRDSYKWGILGTGKIAAKFTHAIKVSDKASLYAVASRDEANAKNFSEIHQIDTYYASYDALIEDEEVDVVYIATPNHLHYPLSKKCIEAGKNVLCEKPICINAKQFQQLSSLAKRNRVFYMDAFWTRFLPAIEKAKVLVDKLGPIKSLKADFGFKAKLDLNSRLFNPQLGGGSLLDIGIYPLFLSLFMLGKPDEIDTNATICSTGVDESISFSLSYDSGAIADLYSTFMSNTATRAEINCENGNVILHPRFHHPVLVEQRIAGHKPKQFEFKYKASGYEYEVAEVINCLDNGWIESRKLPHSFTLLLMETMDEIRKHVGISYGHLEHT